MKKYLLLIYYKAKSSLFKFYILIFSFTCRLNVVTIDALTSVARLVRVVGNLFRATNSLMRVISSEVVA